MSVADGSLGDCVVANGNGTFDAPEAITINPTATIAYIANLNSNLVTICPIESNGLFGTCATAADGSFQYMDGITLSPSGNYLYTADANGSVSSCPVLSDGSLAACVSSGNMGGLLTPQFVAVSPTDPTHLYATGANTATITICDIAAGDGSLSACTSVSGSGPAPNPGFYYAEGMSFNAQGTAAYIGNIGAGGVNYVSICPVIADGAFGDCTISDGNGTYNFAVFTQIDLFISSATHLAYVPNNNNNTLSICPINTDGSLGGCFVSDGGGTLNQPSAVFLARLPGV